MDIRRFGSYTSQPSLHRYPRSEVYSTYYDISYPMQERSSARKLRLSPLYHRLQELGAVFGEKTGWERPNWFASNEHLANGQNGPDPGMGQSLLVSSDRCRAFGYSLASGHV